MSIERSLCKYILGLNYFGGRVYVGNNPDIDLEGISLPYCLVSRLPGYKEEVRYIGDENRQIDAEYQIDIYANTYDDMVSLEQRIRMSLANASGSYDYSDATKILPGIDLYSVRQLLSTNDQLIYNSGQGGWFSTPTPNIYKNNTIISTGFTINYSSGVITFSTANLPADEIRATYKCGLVDFTEVSIIYEPTEIQDRAVFAAFITLRPFIYYKSKSQLLY